MQANREIPSAITVILIGVISPYFLYNNPPNGMGKPAPKWMVMQCTSNLCTLEEAERLSAAGIHTPLLKKSQSYSKTILKELDAHHSDGEQARVLAEITLHFDEKRKHPMLSAEEVSKFQNLVDLLEG